MSRPKSIYTCQSCGHQSPKWVGRCPDCQKWNTLVEETFREPVVQREHRQFHDSATSPVSLVSIASQETYRIPTHIRELDRVLGGGLVPGSLVLVGGDPGIGKSTLVLQAFHSLAKHQSSILYVSGEESLQQIKLRAERLGVAEKSLFLLTETLLENVLKAASQLKPKVIAIDSVQTLFTGELESAPGSVGQVREIVSRLMYFAKKESIATFVIGHVTKEGNIAGPKMLEHMVDTVLYFEGDAGKQYRILRAVKNRFGSTNEIGVFEMNEQGLCEVENPSQLFLSERPMNAPGSVVVSAVEGTRPVLIELQSLVTPTTLAMPRRTAIGVDHNRVSLLAAVLEKRGDLALYGHDIYVNIAGGFRSQEPAIDLGIVAALASSFLDKPVDSNTLFLGEVGLAGEVRAINHIDIRIKEAQRLGFKEFIVPKFNLTKLKKTTAGLQGIATIDELLRILF